MPVNPARSERDPDSRIPLKSIDFLILLMLARSGDRHGYGIMQDVAEHTGGSIELEAGSLYRTIRRLQDDRLLEESNRRPTADLDDERRRYYRLSTFGKRVVAAEAARLRRLVRIAESARLLAPEPAR
jgi:DNA-binding PadR family transcriptional regulator